MSAFAPRSCLVLCLALALPACAGSRGGGGGYAPAVQAPTEAVAQAPSAPASVPASVPAPAPAPDGVVAEGARPAPGEPERASAPQPAAMPAPSGPFTLASAGLTAPTPAGWRTRRKASALVYEGPMRLPSVAMFGPQKADTFQGAVDGLAAELAAPLGAVRITRHPTETTLAGYRAFVAEGTGRAEGFPMRWRATIVDAERPTIILGLAPTFFWGGNAGKIRSFERSIQKAPVQTAALERARTTTR